MTHLASLRDILDSWNVDIEISFKDYVDKVNMREFGWQITEEGTIDKMSDEIAQARVNGLKNLEIHNYPQPNNLEVSLLIVFSGLYGITNEQIRAEGMKNIRQFNKLTANAEKNYGEASFNGERKPNPWILTKILRYHNKDYYEQTIKPLLNQNYEVKKQQKISDTVQQIENHEIDLKDPFTLIDVSSKALNGKYENKLELVAQDLLKVIKVVPCQNEQCIIIKEYDYNEIKANELREEDNLMLQSNFKEEALNKLTEEQLVDVILSQPSVIIQIRKGDEEGMNRRSANNYEKRSCDWIYAKEIKRNRIAGEGICLKEVEYTIYTQITKEYMLIHDLFGTENVDVVEDRTDCHMDRMHMDTVFSIADEKITTFFLLEKAALFVHMNIQRGFLQLKKNSKVSTVPPSQCATALIYLLMSIQQCTDLSIITNVATIMHSITVSKYLKVALKLLGI
ncbi:MAG: hypothetical protein EZS28_026292 [Streblomastix strix]|uniref:Uncharacterized protein n=1 Tax=Streblomastix strix TaxID=222440 RepID=A0A5J4V7H9_9EUKA|nr:MAG: hypothetical protein EZS28_026292 [Streblomastix strix]